MVGDFRKRRLRFFLIERFSAATEGNALKFVAKVELYLSFGSWLRFLSRG